MNKIQKDVMRQRSQFPDCSTRNTAEQSSREMPAKFNVPQRRPENNDSAHALSGVTWGDYLPRLIKGPFPHFLGSASVVEAVRCANDSESDRKELGM